MRYGDEDTADYFVVIFALLSDSRKVLIRYDTMDYINVRPKADE